jgi:hypothetical protein
MLAKLTQVQSCRIVCEVCENDDLGDASASRRFGGDWRQFDMHGWKQRFSKMPWSISVETCFF